MASVASEGVHVHTSVESTEPGAAVPGGRAGRRGLSTRRGCESSQYMLKYQRRCHQKRQPRSAP